MKTFLLTWNPDKWPWPEDQLTAEVEATERGEEVDGVWSVGARKSGVAPGDRAFLLRQHRDRGIVASGRFTSDIREELHWDGSNSTTTFADITWDAVLRAEDRLPVELLKSEVPAVVWDRIQGSGTQLKDEAAAKVETLWAALLERSMVILPGEMSPNTTFSEGSAMKIKVNRYERSRAARKACISHWGTACVTCGFDFGKTYGKVGRGFIHVHHLKPVSTLGPDYQLDPVKELLPVCPNCHAILHKDPALTVTRLKNMLQKGRRP